MEFVFMPHIYRLSGTDLLLNNRNIKNVVKTNLIIEFRSAILSSSKATLFDG